MTAGAPAAAWSELDATDQATLVACGEATALELLEAARERIERIDGELGAVPVRFFDHAMASIRRLDLRAPFAGVPFLMKDVGARQVGQPYYAGNRALGAIDHRAASDTRLGARFREIGLVSLGNSNSPEFGLQSNTWPLAYGPTRNPWNPAHSAGGSSGGACAAVAAGLVPVAHASDGAGSIRIPAAWCGLIGLKPSRDLVTWRHAGKGRRDVEFVVARSLRDTARFLDVLRPRNVREGDSAPYTAAMSARPSGLRVGVCVRSPAGNRVHPDCVLAVEASAELLSGLGHRVEASAPASLFEYEERSLHGAAFGFLEYRECIEELEERLGRGIGSDDVEPFLWELASEAVGEIPDAELRRIADWIRRWEDRTRRWFDDFDLLVTPTVCEPAPLLASLDPHTNAPSELLDKMLPHMAFTEAWNATGQPAISLPLGWSERDRLPVGVQLVAPPGHDARLFAVAAQLLDRAGSGMRRPVLHA